MNTYNCPVFLVYVRLLSPPFPSANQSPKRSMMPNLGISEDLPLIATWLSGFIFTDGLAFRLLYF